MLQVQAAMEPGSIVPATCESVRQVLGTWCKELDPPRPGSKWCLSHPLSGKPDKCPTGSLFDKCSDYWNNCRLPPPPQNGGDSIDGAPLCDCCTMQSAEEVEVAADEKAMLQLQAGDVAPPPAFPGAAAVDARRGRALVSAGSGRRVMHKRRRQGQVPPWRQGQVPPGAQQQVTIGQAPAQAGVTGAASPSEARATAGLGPNEMAGNLPQDVHRNSTGLEEQAQALIKMVSEAIAPLVNVTRALAPGGQDTAMSSAQPEAEATPAMAPAPTPPARAPVQVPGVQPGYFAGSIEIGDAESQLPPLPAASGAPMPPSTGPTAASEAPQQARSLVSAGAAGVRRVKRKRQRSGSAQEPPAPPLREHPGSAVRVQSHVLVGSGASVPPSSSFAAVANGPYQGQVVASADPNGHGELPEHFDDVQPTPYAHGPTDGHRRLKRKRRHSGSAREAGHAATPKRVTAWSFVGSASAQGHKDTDQDAQGHKDTDQESGQADCPPPIPTTTPEWWRFTTSTTTHTTHTGTRPTTVTMTTTCLKAIQSYLLHSSGACGPTTAFLGMQVKNEWDCRALVQEMNRQEGVHVNTYIVGRPLGWMDGWCYSGQEFTSQQIEEWLEQAPAERRCPLRTRGRTEWDNGHAGGRHFDFYVFREECVEFDTKKVKRQ